MDLRAVKIIFILINNSKPTSMEFLCKSMNLKPRTIREIFLQNRDVLYTKYGSSIENIRQEGYVLKVEDKDKFLTFLNQYKDQGAKTTSLELPKTQEERVLYLIRYFLTHNNYIKIRELAEKMYVSRSTLNSDLKLVREALHKHNLSFDSKPRYGIKMVGDEFDIRTTMAKYLYFDTIYGFNESKLFLSELIDSKDNQLIKECLTSILKKHNIRLTEVGFRNLIIHLHIAISRLKDKITLPIDRDKIDALKDNVEYKVALEIAQKLSNCFDISFNESEVYYITIHLMGKKYIEITKNSQDEINIDLLYACLNVIKETYQIDFSQDEELVSMLLAHFNPMMSRLEHGLKTSNPVLERIKKEHFFAFDIAVLFGETIQKLTQYRIDENEIGFLALHFAFSLSKMKEQEDFNVILVCASGAGTSRILLSQIKEKFPNTFNKIQVAASHEIENLDIHDYDFIISVVDLESKYAIPVVNVNYFLEDDDVKSIENVILNQSDYDFIRSSFRKEFFFYHLEENTKEDIIKRMIEEINQHHKTPDNLYSLILEREKLASTEYGNMVALPHPTKLIMNDTFISIAVLEKPIAWDKKQVKYVFMLLFENDAQLAVSSLNEILGNVIQSPEILKILDTNNYDTFIKSIESLMSFEEKSSIFK